MSTDSASIFVCPSVTVALCATAVPCRHEMLNLYRYRSSCKLFPLPQTQDHCFLSLYLPLASIRLRPSSCRLSVLPCPISGRCSVLVPMLTRSTNKYHSVTYFYFHISPEKLHPLLSSCCFTFCHSVLLECRSCRRGPFSLVSVATECRYSVILVTNGLVSIEAVVCLYPHSNTHTHTVK
jgi:hypothetical protein